MAEEKNATDAMSETNSTTSQSDNTAAAPKKSGSNKTLMIVGIVLVACCVISFIAGGVLVATGAILSQEKTIEESDSNSIGETKTVDDWEVTLNGVKKTVNDEYVVDLTVKNNSDNQQIFSSLLQMNLVNGDGDDYNLALNYNLDESEIIDGEVDAGSTKSGKMAYEVDDDPESIKLVVTGGLLSAEEVEFVIE